MPFADASRSCPTLYKSRDYFKMRVKSHMRFLLNAIKMCKVRAMVELFANDQIMDKLYMLDYKDLNISSILKTCIPFLTTSSRFEIDLFYSSS